MTDKTEIDYDSISPGIVDLVRELNEVHKIKTSDSGDGSLHRGGMTCAHPARHVFMHCYSQYDGHRLKKKLAGLYPYALVQVTDPDPSGDAWVLLWPDGEAIYGDFDTIHGERHSLGELVTELWRRIKKKTADLYYDR